METTMSRIQHVGQIVNAKSVVKTIATTAATAALGPAAVPVGVTAYAVSKVAQNFCESEAAKETFQFVGDVGGHSAIGGELGSMVGTMGTHLFKEFSHAVISNGNASTFISEATEKAISYKQTTCENAESLVNSMIGANSSENAQEESTKITEIESSLERALQMIREQRANIQWAEFNKNIEVVTRMVNDLNGCESNIPSSKSPFLFFHNIQNVII